MYKRIVEAKLYIDAHYAEKINLDNISDQASFSKYHFLRLFKNAFGKSPHAYLTEVRIEQAKKLLKERQSVAAVGEQVGFESIPSFIHLFKRVVGITPHEFLLKEEAKRAEAAETPLKFVPNCFAENHGWKE